MRTLLIILLCCAVACAAPDPGPRFDDETAATARELTCMKHQPQPPGTRYTEATRRTGDTLALLRYYTANGRKPYCDGKGPTSSDRPWIDLYVRLGADRANVAPLLDG